MLANSFEISSPGRIGSAVDRADPIDGSQIAAPLRVRQSVHWQMAFGNAVDRCRRKSNSSYLRGAKADIWEGGHRVPYITTWPAKIEAGSTSDALIELTDLLATTAAIVGEELSAGEGPDSRNTLPIMLDSGNAEPVREYAVHHSLWGTFAIRRGPWKMIPARGSGGFTAPREIQPEAGEPVGQLYNLDQDPSETKNVWNEHPDIVEQLQELLAHVQAM